VDRRTFLAGSLGLLAAPLAVEAQPAGRVYRVGFMVTTSPVSEMVGADPVNPGARALVHGLRNLGYVDGRNLILDFRSAEGRFERFADILTDLVRQKADVIVIGDTRVAEVVRTVTSTVPVVMGASVDPVGRGIVQSLARPGGNVTGLTLDVGHEIHGKRLELLREAVPGASRVAVLATKEIWDLYYGKALKAAAHALGLTVFLAEHTPAQYADAFALIRQQRADALFVAQSSENFGNRRLIGEFTTRHRLPSIHAFREGAQVGGLMSYGVNVPDLFRRAAGYVDKILKGAKPGDLPIEQPTKFELVINLMTAKALGLTIPPSVLVRADEVIE
jgi:putative ABC transport system substrate-binding protein